MSADNVPSCTTVTGEAVAKPFRAAIQAATKDLSPSARPKLVGLLANSNPPSRAYAQWTAKACEAVGIAYELREVGHGAHDGGEGEQEEASQGDVEEAILAANEDPNVHGIMVYYPIFGPRQDGYLQQAVSPLKDVEGLNFTWLFSLYHNQRFIDPRKLALAAQVTSPTPAISAPAQVAATAADVAQNPASASAAAKATAAAEDSGLVKAILPCTPLAIVKTLEHCQVYNPLLPYGGRAYGKTITVINRSEVVGRPLAALLSNDGARVFSVDLDGIQEFTKRKQSTMTAAGGGTTTRAAFHPHHIVQSCKLSLEQCLALSDAVVSGVPSKSYQVATDQLKDGVVAINFSENKNFEPSVKDKASIYVPGIGKATIVLLQRNLMRLREYQDALAQAGQKP